ncbi:MAG: hypothetical protein SVY53_04955 [Chloroflexota bacterium]|nr:hypothetical protein [Chloroflexota bacterium]
MAGKMQEIIMNVPDIADGETLKYRLTDSKGKTDYGHQTQVVTRFQETGKDFYKVYSLTEYPDKGTLEETAIYEVKDHLKPISFQKVTKSRSGKVLVNTDESYSHYHEEGIEIPVNSMTQSVTSTFALRGGPFKPNVPFGEKSRTTFYCLFPPGGRLLKMYGETTKEKIKVPAGTFDCFKLQWSLDIESMLENMMPPGFEAPPGFETFGSNFMPPMIRWFSQKEPHYMVKSEGTIINPVPFVCPDPSVQELISTK